MCVVVMMSVMISTIATAIAISVSSAMIVITMSCMHVCITRISIVNIGRTSIVRSMRGMTIMNLTSGVRDTLCIRSGRNIRSMRSISSSCRICGGSNRRRRCRKCSITSMRSMSSNRVTDMMFSKSVVRSLKIVTIIAVAIRITSLGVLSIVYDYNFECGEYYVYD